MTDRLCDDLARIIGAHVALRRRGAGLIGLCPFHNERTPSFTVTPGRQQWKCFGCGKGGRGSNSFLRALGQPTNGHDTPFIKREEQTYPEVDWSRFRLRVTHDRVKQLAFWRGYSLAFCQWLAKEGHIGIYENRLYCFPIYHGSRCVRVHIRADSGRWFYYPRDSEAYTTALVIAPEKAVSAFLFESQWDTFAMMDALKQHQELTHAWVATRGACNGSKLRVPPAWKKVTLIPQNDGTARCGGRPASKGEKWLADCKSLMSRAAVVRVSGPYKDLNEFTKAGSDAAALL